ncbi:hypothetical protein ACJRO7_002995 [Eucalyptus globulus]|uniref:C2 domain-containing protein n=1 Tax=Eucalyptus globulus TaxID=34317 RepID=A0ABD3ITJ3_EUCGL
MAVGVLEVLLVSAKGLGNTDFFDGLIGKMDPYVLIQYKTQERKSSIARGQGSNPSWGEKFTFRVEYPGEGDHHQFKLNLKIMDKDTFSADDYIGSATIFLEDFLALGVENGTAELHPSKYRVVRMDQSYCGEIQVGLTFNLREEPEINEEYGGWKQSEY